MKLLFGASILALILLSSTSAIEVNAGLYSSVAKKAARKAITKPKPVKLPESKASTTKSQAELGMVKISAGGVLTAAERAKYTEILARLDHDALALIEKRFGAYIAPEKMAMARQTPTAFLDQATYRQALRKTDPTLTEKEIAETLGHYLPSTSKTHVNHNTIVVPNVTAHERLHQLANPKFAERFGPDMDEGATGYFSRHIYGELGLLETQGMNYPEYRRLINLMGSRVGDEPIAKAYFQGDFRALQQGLDNDLGQGAFEAVSRHLYSGEFKQAELILLGVSH